MTVVFKTGLTIPTLVQGLWTAEEAKGGLYNIALELQAAGYELRVSPSSLSIVYNSVDEEMIGISQCGMKAETLKMAMHKKVGYLVKTSLKKKITTLIDAAHIYIQTHGKVAYIGNGSEFKIKIMSQYSKDQSIVVAIKTLRELTGWGLKESKGKVDEWIALVVITAPVEAKIESVAQENPQYKSTHSHIMDLVDAEHLHQAVHGTSDGSRYYVIALGDDAKVAIRINSETDISIKAICTKAPQSHKGQAVTKAFERASLKKAEGGHWSLHLNPKSMEMVMRSIGSTLFVMDIPFYAVTGNLSVLEGK